MDYIDYFELPIVQKIFVFFSSFVSVFYGIQLAKIVHSFYTKKRSSSSSSSGSSSSSSGRIKNHITTTLPLDDFVDMKLTRKDILSHDTVKFTFALPNPNDVLGLPTGQHVSLKYYITDESDGSQTAVQRSYTPVTDNTSVGEFSLVVKVYRPLPPKFPTGGKMSQHLDSLSIGDSILVHGPKGHTEYFGQGKFSVKPLGKPLQQRTSRHIALMAGGTGITPMLQILHHIFKTDAKSDKKTQVRLIYANQTEDDILVREELEHLQVTYPDRFTLWYTIDRIVEGKRAEDWNYDIGFITAEMVQKHLLFPSHVKDTQFLMCGPPPMIKFACIPALQSFGYTDKDWIIY